MKNEITVTEVDEQTKDDLPTCGYVIDNNGGIAYVNCLSGPYSPRVVYPSGTTNLLILDNKEMVAKVNSGDSRWRWFNGTITQKQVK